jgi:ABC-type bacteriocin/lantibiotic exporters, contain an N-terminal double-glycine peptidase domain
VVFKYPTRDSTILDAVSFNIKAGEIVGIVGQSGSGKSSIFNLLTCLYAPVSGNVFINGVNINEKPAWWPRKMISIVSQEALLFSGSILENIKYSDQQASEEAIIEACKRADAYDFINDLPNGFQTQVGEHGYALSGGQRQRVLIARALLKKPHIFLFDEATSALDANSEGYFQDVIEKEFRGKGYTVLIISHRVKALKDITDRILLINEGKILGFDSYVNLAKHSEFQLLL